MEKVESVTKILSAIAIPIIIALIGWDIEEKISNKNLNRDYVKMSLDILTSEGEVDQTLRAWAVDLLSENAPTEMNDEVKEKLKNGEVKLPTPESAYNLLENGQLGSSLDMWTELIRREPNDPFNYYHRSTTYRKLGQLTLALEDLDKVISLANNHRNAWNNRGMLKLQLSRKNEGCQDLQQAAEMGHQKAKENVQRFCQN